MPHRKTAGCQNEEQIWKSRRIFQKRENVSKARGGFERKVGGLNSKKVSKARRYRRHGGIEGQKEISTAIRRSRKREDILKKWSGEERLEISKTNKTSI